MSTVDALSYQTYIQGMDGVKDSVEDVLYVPAYKLELWSRGVAELAHTPVMHYRKGKPQKMVYVDKKKVEEICMLISISPRVANIHDRIKGIVKSVFENVIE